MCGRYSIINPKEIYKSFNIPENKELELEPSYNIAPGSSMPVVTNDGKSNQISISYWGLIPSWAKDPKIGYKMINARAETLNEKPSYRKPLKANRCIVPASGFFEWDRNNKEKLPYYIKPKGKEMFGFAGLCEEWTDGKQEIPSFTIVTQDAKGEIKNIHNRMPVILGEKDQKVWLDGKINDTEFLMELVRNNKDKDYEMYRVSKEANKPVNNYKEILEPI